VNEYEKGIKAATDALHRISEVEDDSEYWTEEMVDAFLACQPKEWRCVEHDAQAIPRLGFDPDTCWKGQWIRHLSVADCRMVNARIVIDS
jgi:hypothetical protein